MFNGLHVAKSLVLGWGGGAAPHGFALKSRFFFHSNNKSYVFCYSYTLRTDTGCFF